MKYFNGQIRFKELTAIQFKQALNTITVYNVKHREMITDISLHTITQQYVIYAPNKNIDDYTIVYSQSDMQTMYKRGLIEIINQN